jgi:gluconate 2-dehydrogenase gamma chain
VNNGRPAEALSDRDAEILVAVLERMIPADDVSPGATEACVARYVRRALATEYAEQVAAYEDGLAAVDTFARDRHGDAFVALGPDAQDAILRSFEHGLATDVTPAPSAFFELVRRHAIEGMFGDPAWGGNAEVAGWRLLGYPGPKRAWSETEQRIDT